MAEYGFGSIEFFAVFKLPGEAVGIYAHTYTRATELSRLGIGGK